MNVKNILISLMMILVIPLLLEAQSTRIQQLNSKIMRNYVRSERNTRSLTLIREVDVVLSERFSLLKQLAEDAPDQLLTETFSEETLTQLRRMYPNSPLESRGSVRGIYELEVEDGPSGSSYFKEFAGVNDGRHSYPLRFSSKALTQNLNPGDLIMTTGVLLGNEMMIADTVEIEASAVSCSSMGNQPVAIIKARFPGTTPSLSNANIEDWMFSETNQSLTRYWREASYGKTWATGDVYPSGVDEWYTLDREYACTESSALRAAAWALADSDINFQNYSRIIVVFPRPSTGCSFAGRASIGCWVANPDGPGSVGYSLQVLNSMGNRTSAIQLTTHELGHTLGLYHASSLSYPGNEPIGDPINSGSISEYGDRYASEGFWNLGHYSGVHKRALNWLSENTVSQNSDVLLTPSDSFPDVLVVPRNSSQSLWIEYIRQLGEYKSTAVVSPRNGIIIRLKDSASYNNNSKLLNFGSSVTNASLNTGQLWQDPYTDLSLEVGEATDQGVLVKVRWGVVSCTPQTPTITVTPSVSQTIYPNPITYTLAITNNDTGTCVDSVFTIHQTAISDLQFVNSEVILTIPKGTTKSTTVKVTPLIEPATATNYALSFQASRTL